MSISEKRLEQVFKERDARWMTELEQSRSLAKSLEGQLRSANDQVEVLDAELERVKRQNAAITGAFISRKSEFELGLLALGRGNPQFNQTYCECDPEVGASPCAYCAEYSALRGALDCCTVAMPSDAGHDYISKDSVRPLVEALQTANQALNYATEVRAKCSNALLIARQLGLLEDGK